LRRLAIAASGALVGLAMAAGLGACDYFDCDTVDRPLASGGYTLFGRPDHSLVLDLESGVAVETYTDGGEATRVEYSIGPDMPVP
jgi:hypothetical protein